MKVELDENQVDLLQGLLRQAIRKTARNAIKGRLRFGEEYEEERLTGRMTFLHGIYEALGGDPDNITNVRDWEDDGQPGD